MLQCTNARQQFCGNRVRHAHANRRAVHRERASAREPRRPRMRRPIRFNGCGTRRRPFRANSSKTRRGSSFTSGSTGSPKGVVHGHDTYLAKLDAIDEAMALGRQRVLLPLQLTFAYAQWVALTTLLRGGEVIIANPFDPDRFVQSLEQGATAMAVVPTMLRKLRPLIEAGRCAAFAGVVMSGGEPLPAELGLFIRQHWPRSRPVGYLRPDRNGNVGLLCQAGRSMTAQRGRSAIPRPASTSACHRKTVNCRSARLYLMRGYLDDPELTAAALSDGYFRTGDQARVRARRHGRDHRPAERHGQPRRHQDRAARVERVFSGHPDVADALATGLPERSNRRSPACGCRWPVTGATPDPPPTRIAELGIAIRWTATSCPTRCISWTVRLAHRRDGQGRPQGPAQRELFGQTTKRRSLSPRAKRVADELAGCRQRQLVNELDFARIFMGGQPLSLTHVWISRSRSDDGSHARPPAG